MCFMYYQQCPVPIQKKINPCGKLQGISDEYITTKIKSYQNADKEENHKVRSQNEAFFV